MSVSVPPPGWVEPPRAVAATSGPARVHDDLRSENRRLLDSRRVRARFLDLLIVAPLGYAAAWEWGWNFGTYAIFQCLLLILNHVCEVTTGATPGKRRFGLRVANLDDGALPKPRQAAVRGVIGIFEFGLIAAIAIMSTKSRRRLGDRAAGTAVVDARKHPVQPRPLFAGALVYPVVWAVPAVIACVLGARGVLPDSYRAQADYWCWGYSLPADLSSPTRYKGIAAADRAARAKSPETVAATRIVETQALDLNMVRAVATLQPPHAWRAKHEDLVRRLNARLDRRQQWARERVASPGRATDAAWLARDQRALADDDAALAAQGFHDCAHRP